MLSSPAVPRASARPRQPAWRIWAPGSPPPAATATAPNLPPPTSAPHPAILRWTCSPRTCPPRPRSAACRCDPARLPTPGRAGQQRGWVLGPPACHRRRPGTHLRAQPPRPVPAHQPVAEPPQSQRTGAGGHGVLWCARQRPHRLRRPARCGPYSGQRAYSASKLANVMFTYEPARRLAGTGVTATVLHPGVVRTNFGADDPAGLIKMVLPLVRPFMKSPAAGAATAIYLASATEVEGITCGISPTASRRLPPRSPTTPPSRHGCGMSAPNWSAWQQSRRATSSAPIRVPARSEQARKE